MAGTPLDPLTRLTIPLLHQMTSNLGTTAWCAPELLTATAKARYTVKVDVYSYGMVLWELWERKRPYEELYSRFDIIDAVRAGRRPPIGSGCPAAYRSLIQRCWHEQPARRPTFAYIVRYLKDELAHIKRQRTTSSSAHAMSPLHRLVNDSHRHSDEFTNSHLHDSNTSAMEQKVEKEKEKKSSNWASFMSPMAALANMTLNQNSNENEKKYARDTDTIVSSPFPMPRSSAPSSAAAAAAFDDNEATTRSTFSYLPRPLSMPQKPTPENLDDLASSPWASGEFLPEEGSQQQQQQQARASTAWRDKYVLKFSGWKHSKPDTGLPPSLVSRPLSASVNAPVLAERQSEARDSEYQDDSSDDTSPKYSSFIDARGPDGEPLPAEVSVELDTYSSTNSAHSNAAEHETI
jgi:serine/threonine protein kinase